MAFFDMFAAYEYAHDHYSIVFLIRGSYRAGGFLCSAVSLCAVDTRSRVRGSAFVGVAVCFFFLHDIPVCQCSLLLRYMHDFDV